MEESHKSYEPLECNRKRISELIEGRERVELELGCGPNKRHLSAIGIDVRAFPGVDLVGDATKLLDLFPNDSVDAIWSYHFFEHIQDISNLIGVLARVSKFDAVIEITVPHFSNPFFYSDPTHKTFFGLYTMSYFAKDDIFARKVPNYDSSFDFRLTSVQLRFLSIRPRYIRHTGKKILQFFVNFNSWTKELYEELFPYLFPCYEIRFCLRRL